MIGLGPYEDFHAAASHNLPGVRAALNAPDSEARAARGTTTDSTSDPRA